MKKITLIVVILFLVSTTTIFADTIPVDPDPHDPFVIPNTPVLPNH